MRDRHPEMGRSAKIGKISQTDRDGGAFAPPASSFVLKSFLRHNLLCAITSLRSAIAPSFRATTNSKNEAVALRRASVLFYRQAATRMSLKQKCPMAKRQKLEN